MTSPLCLFGEVLFDVFPGNHSVLGGAPFNVAWHLQAFGLSPTLISRVGRDEPGARIREAMQDWHMDVTGLQTDDDLPTGRVQVSLRDGEPDYDIVHPVAYDAIASPESKALACRFLYHGTLALRDDISRRTLAGLVAGAPGTVFMDVNLRPPWWQREQVKAMLRHADWVKLNTSEFALLHSESGNREQLEEFLALYRLRGLVLTHGSEGGQLLTAAGEHHRVRPDAGIDVVDTVGAGDAFTSVIILGLQLDWPLADTLQRAQAFASAIIGNRGATVDDPGFYRDFLRDWHINTQ